jgi:signal transduction histidine kinase
MNDESQLLFRLWMGLSAPACLLVLMLVAYQRQRHISDLLFGILLSAWLIRLALQLPQPPPVAGTGFRTAVCLVATAVFSFGYEFTRGPRRSQLVAIGAFILILVASTGLTSWMVLSDTGGQATLIWQLAHAGLALAILVGTWSAWRQRRISRSVVCCVGAGLLILGGGLLFPRGTSFAMPFFSYLYIGVLSAAWLVSTGRLQLGRGRMRRATDPLAGLYRNADSFDISPESFSTGARADKAVKTERMRIARDLHDGLGSQLVGLIARYDLHDPAQQQMVLALEECLLELKRVVDSIDMEELDSLPYALGRLRHRVQPSLDRLGMSLNWHVDDHPVLHALGPSRVEQLLRITQEALCNVMRHSQAQHVEVSLLHDESASQMKLQIRDDGCGISDSRSTRGDQASLGTGLAGIHQRCRAIQAEIDIISVHRQGTVVRVSMPLQSEPHPVSRERWWSALHRPFFRAF